MNLKAHVYAIDCEIVNKGRRLAASKRRVCWKFGFPCQDSVDTGLTGTDCRGQEHQVVLVWSLTSGKQRVLADGVEVHFARQSLQDKFECSWTMQGGHELKVVAHRLSPLFKQNTEFRQFELFVDGVSYSDMSQIFQLGGMSRTPSNCRPTSLVPRRHNSSLGISHHARNQSPGVIQAHECPPRRIQSLPRLEQAVDLLDLSTPASEPENPFEHLASNFGGRDMPPMSPQSAFAPSCFQSPPPKASWQHSTPETVSTHTWSTQSSASYGSTSSTPATQALPDFRYPQNMWSPQAESLPFGAPQPVFAG